MANSTFSGPVRSENGFLEKDEAGNWVPVSGGGGGGGEPLAVPLRLATNRFDTVPALPIINISGQDLYEYYGTESSTITVKPSGVVPGTYSNPVVSIQFETGLITAAAEGVAPSPGPSTAPVVGYASVSTVLNATTVTIATDAATAMPANGRTKPEKSNILPFDFLTTTLISGSCSIAR